MTTNHENHIPFTGIAIAATAYVVARNRGRMTPAQRRWDSAGWLALFAQVAFLVVAFLAGGVLALSMGANAFLLFLLGMVVLVPVSDRFAKRHLRPWIFNHLH